MSENISRGEALHLIQKTVSNFYRDVMFPLERDIHLYDKEYNANAIRLHEYFYDFLIALGRISPVASNALKELNNFQLSQLLSLCRDISELYNLPIFKQMPDIIPDDSPIRYVDPGTTSNSEIYALGLVELNARIISGIISKANSETDSWNRYLLELIAEGINKLDPSHEKKIIEIAEEKLQSLSGSEWYQPFIETALRSLSGNRKIMDGFLEGLRYPTLSVPSDLSRLIDRRNDLINSLSANGLEPTAEVRQGGNTSWLQDLQTWFSANGWKFGVLPPRVKWSGENTTIEASFDLPSCISELQFKSYVLDDTTLSMRFGYNLLNNEISGGVSFDHHPTMLNQMPGFNAEVSFKHFNDNTFEVTVKWGTTFSWDRYSHLDVYGSVTTSNENPRASFGTAIIKNDEGRTGSIRGETEFSRGGITTSLLASIALSKNISIGTKVNIPLTRNSSSNKSLSFNIAFRGK